MLRKLRARGFQVLLALALPLLALASIPASPSLGELVPVEATPGEGQPLQPHTPAPAAGEPARSPESPEVVVEPSPPLDDSGDRFPSEARTTGGLCGGPEVLTVLIVGSDSRDDTFVYGLADVIRVARLDFSAGQISVLSLPRDLWVEIPGISDHYGITHGKLNQAYLYGGSGMGYYDGPGGGPGLLALTLERNFGLTVDRTLAVNMGTFVEVVDAVGGLDLYLEETVDGRAGGNEEDLFESGWNHLDGERALRFARLRAGYDDLTRIENQSVLLTALRTKLLSPAVLPRLPEVAEAFWEALYTDLTLRDFPPLLCLFSELSGENLRFVDIPRSALTGGRVYSAQLGGRVSVLRGDPEELRQLVRDFLMGK